MAIKVVFTSQVFEELKAACFWDGKEKMAYVACHSSSYGDDVKLIADTVLAPTDADYERRSLGGFRVEREFANKVVNYCIQEQLDLLQVHIHPGDEAVRFSLVDKHHEPLFMEEVAKQVRGIYHASLVFSRDFSSVDGWFYNRSEGTLVAIEKLLVIGVEGLEVYLPARSDLLFKAGPEGCGRLDRTVKAFGADAVRMLGLLDIGVVGASALGGPILEMLARDGVNSITMCDDDRIDESNLNRLQGAAPSDVGTFKVEFYDQYIGRINPDVEIFSYNANFYDEEVQRAFSQVDVVIGCVDSGARFSINTNTLCCANCIPYFDLGAGIIREKGKVTFKGGHVLSVIPGREVCLHCSGLYAGLKNESMSQEIKEMRRQRGYIDADDEVRPLVAHLDSLVAGMGYHAMLSYLWGESSAEDFKLYCDLARSQMMASSVDREGCMNCEPDGMLGKGDKVPFLVPADLAEVSFDDIEACLEDEEEIVEELPVAGSSV